MSESPPFDPASFDSSAFDPSGLSPFVSQSYRVAIEQQTRRQAYDLWRRRQAPDRLARLQRRLAAASVPTREPLASDTTLRLLLFAPLGLLAGLILLAVGAPFVPGGMTMLLGPQGLIAEATALLTFAAAWAATRLAVQERPPRPAPLYAGDPRHPAIWPRLWFGLCALGLIFLGGEAIQWGRPWFVWAAPEWAAALDLAAAPAGSLLNAGLSDPAFGLPFAERLLTAAQTALPLTAVVFFGIGCPIWIWLHGPLRAVRTSPLHLIWPSPALWSTAACASAIKLAAAILAAHGGAAAELAGPLTIAFAGPLAAPGATPLAIPAIDGTPLGVALTQGLRAAGDLFVMLFAALYLFDTARRYHAAHQDQSVPSPAERAAAARG